MNLFRTLLAAGAVTLVAGVASAATCTVDNVTYMLSQTGGDPSVAACESGNDEGTPNYGNQNGWTLSDSVGWDGVDDPDSGFDLMIGDGTWSITGAEGYDAIAIALKQSNSFAFFLLDVTKTLTGTWSISGPGNSIQVYSHINGWTQGSPSEIPLPAAGFLLLGGLGGLAMLRRRK